MNQLFLALFTIVGLSSESAFAFSERGPEFRDYSKPSKYSWRSEHEIASFSSDGCSGFIDGTPTDTDAWSYCCEVHDIAYWAGVGGEAMHSKADQDLKQCIDKAGYPNIAEVVYDAVRVMRIPNITMPLPFRWGYGWPGVNGYNEFNQSQLYSIKDNLPYIMEGIVTNRIQSDFPAPSVFELQAINAKILELEQTINQILPDAQP